MSIIHRVTKFQMITHALLYQQMIPLQLKKKRMTYDTTPII